LFLLSVILFSTYCLATTNLADDLRGIEFLPNFLPANISGRKYCPTEDIWKWKKSVRDNSFHFGSPFACATEGNCDNYAERNKWTKKNLHIKLHITVLCATSTSCAGGVTQSRVHDQVAQINKDFAGSGITFSAAETKFYVDATYAEIPAYSGSNSNWYTALVNLKNKYAVSPTSYLNVFITAQKSGTAGTLLGIGTFPWDSASTKSTGGLWLNANYVKSGDKTASHEIGHCVGLWHTFHGDSEVSCTSQCYETVHSDSGDTTASNSVGDFCADTPAQPMNYYCSYPTGTDCKGTKYTLYGNNPVLINNIMAYTPDTCMESFTPQQIMRAHCWTCAKLGAYDSVACK